MNNKRKKNCIQKGFLPVISVDSPSAIFRQKYCSDEISCLEIRETTFCLPGVFGKAIWLQDTRVVTTIP